MDTHQRTRQSKQPLVLTALGTVVAAFLFWVAFLRPAPAPALPVVTKAVAVLKGDSGASGTVTFAQTAPTAPVTITGELRGLDPRAERGFHIHTSGDLSAGCVSAGAHYNPLEKTHGAPTADERHIGDLGNVLSDAQGAVQLSMEDKLISLNGPLSIVGRAVVLHAGTDDLGKGGNEDSLQTGNAGGRVACGVIGISQ
ncbi:uncharacterized protein LAESUDRAFT_722865 [Laetiporus sulphureus 93-53]|uniref:Superoxide dismutase [Cu-Zn] n=1 Tax=Laetiporus sulphureus 93-53 TaxID=1314785 RepID=A0A165FLH5_9APHY|nr:uncharacterized protein LAESUDRAFT_722865 [Laetiporus sulphureus 93-53]KZT09149.1 hypothetical protein LAESUDRAFT_722865 [Laetiporus sulphureus 93-53]